MVRKYVKKISNPYMLRTRLSEAQFTAIASGYLALMSATEVEKYVRANAKTLFKSWDSETKPISRNTINRVFAKLDERLSELVEDGLLHGFPYGLEDISDPDEKEVQINQIISQVYLLLTDKVSKERVNQLHDIWRKQGEGFLYDSLIWKGTEIMWKKMSGLDHDALRHLFNRVAFVSFLIDAYKETSAVEASNAILEFLLDHLRKRPLE